LFVVAIINSDSSIQIRSPLLNRVAAFLFCARSSISGLTQAHLQSKAQVLIKVGKIVNDFEAVFFGESVGSANISAVIEAGLFFESATEVNNRRCLCQERCLTTKFANLSNCAVELGLKCVDDIFHTLKSCN